MFPGFVAGAGPTEVAILALVVGAYLGALAAAIHVLLRDDLDTGRKAGIFVLVVLVPLAWVPYFLLVHEDAEPAGEG